MNCYAFRYGKKRVQENVNILSDSTNYNEPVSKHIRQDPMELQTSNSIPMNKENNVVLEELM